MHRHEFVKQDAAGFGVQVARTVQDCSRVLVFSPFTLRPLAQCEAFG